MEEAAHRPRKTFTIAEANALLPKVIPLAQQLQGLHRSVLDVNTELDEAVEKLAGGNGYPVQSLKDRIESLTKRQLNLIEAFQSALNQLEDLGCVVKDVSRGLIDFYGMREGTLIFFCWQLGEERVGAWHTLESGFAERRSVKDL